MPTDKASNSNRKAKKQGKTAKNGGSTQIQISAINERLMSLAKAYPDELPSDMAANNNTIIVESAASKKKIHQFKRASKDDFEHVKPEEFSDDDCDTAAAQKAKTTSSILIPGD